MWLILNYNPDFEKVWQTFPNSSRSPQFLDVYRLLLKEEGMFQSDNYGPVPTVWCAATINFKMTLFSPNIE